MFNLWEAIRRVCLGNIAEEDARLTYLNISKQINTLLNSLKAGEWGQSYGTEPTKTYRELRLMNLTKFMTSSLQGKLEKFYKREEKFRNLKEKSDKNIIKNLFDKKRKPMLYPEGFTRHIYKVILRKKFTKEDLKENKIDLTDKEFKKLKILMQGKEVKAFMDFCRETIKKAKSIRNELIKTYRKEILLPETRRNSLTLIYASATVLLVIFTISTAKTSQSAARESQNTALASQELVDKQIALIDAQLKAISPLNPEIEFYVNNERSKPYFSRTDLATPIEHYSEDSSRKLKTWNKEPIEFTILNRGQLPAGEVQIEIKSNILEVSYKGREKLGGPDIKEITFFIWYKGCQSGKSIKECSRTKVPPGVHELEVRIDCKYCENPVEKKEKICIYNHDEKECERLLKSE